MNDVINYVILPALGWLLINSNKTQRRLTRMETQLENLVRKIKHN